MTDAASKFPSFYDEIMAEVPMDRWVTFKEVWTILKERPYFKRSYVKFALSRGVKRKVLIDRNTGRTNQAHKNSFKCPIYEYRRIVSKRIGQLPVNGRVPWHVNPKKKKRKKSEFSPNAKLAREQVLEVRRLYACGISYTELGRMYGIDPANASRIVRGKTYRHIPFEDDGPKVTGRRRARETRPDLV